MIELSTEEYGSGCHHWVSDGVANAMSTTSRLHDDMLGVFSRVRAAVNAHVWVEYPTVDELSTVFRGKLKEESSDLVSRCFAELRKELDEELKPEADAAITDETLLNDLQQWLYETYKDLNR